jgi:CHAD domain-containing protein
MCSLRERALDFTDPEGVHDMRVSSRRLRSALRDFSAFIKKGKLGESIDQIRILADALGEVRDDDVAIIELQKIKDEAPPERATDIQKLIDIIDVKRTQARRSLEAQLTPRKLNRLRRNFVDALPSALAGPKRKKDETTYYQLAKAVIVERVGELTSLANSLHKPHHTKPLHRMRIAAKRLRYAVELFAPCWGDRSLSYARQIANMQSSLGGLHDCDVWIEYFGDWLTEDHSGKDKKNDSQRDAMVWLLGHFTRLRAKYFRSALSQWRDWERKDFLNRLLNTHSEVSASASRMEPEGQSAEETASKVAALPKSPRGKVKPRGLKVTTTVAVDPTEGEKEITPVKREVTLDELGGKEETTVTNTQEAATG